MFELFVEINKLQIENDRMLVACVYYVGFVTQLQGSMISVKKNFKQFSSLSLELEVLTGYKYLLLSIFVLMN